MPDRPDTRTGDRHRSNALSVRLPASDRAWLLAYAAETGEAYGAIIARLVAAERRRVTRAARRNKA